MNSVHIPDGNIICSLNSSSQSSENSDDSSVVEDETSIKKEYHFDVEEFKNSYKEDDEISDNEINSSQEIPYTVDGTEIYPVRDFKSIGQCFIIENDQFEPLLGLPERI